MNQKHTAIKILKLGASLKLTVVCLVVMIILVIWGTLFQAENGLYQAQQTFFHSWYFMVLGFIPFPGTVLVMFILFVNLVLALIFRIRFRLANIGNIIIHLGIIVLLTGSFWTYYYSVESSLMLKEGETSRMSSSRYLWELAVWQETGGVRTVSAIDAGGFEAGGHIRFDLDGLPLQLKINSFYQNCKAYTGGAGLNSEPVVNASGIQHLEPQETVAEVSENTVGGVFKITSPEGAPVILLYGAETTPTTVSMQNQRISFSLRRKKIPLNLAITLLDFKMKMYPNSNIPKSYESRVAIKTEGGMEREVNISMNKPLRHSDLTFFQSSYYTAPDGSQYTILAVVKNSGRLLPYISSILIFLGLAIHFIYMLIKPKIQFRSDREPIKKKRKKLQLVILICSLMGLFPGASESSLYAEVPSLETFQRVVVLEQGRTKPLDTFAQNILKQFSGRSRFNGQPAIQWLARTILDPESSYHDKVFLITNPDVLDSIAVQRQGKARDRYSFSQLQPGLKQLRQLAFKASKLENKDRDFIENEIIALYNKLYVYQQLTASFEFLSPHPDFTVAQQENREALGFPKDKSDYCFLDIAEKQSKILQLVETAKQHTETTEEKSVIGAELNRLADRLDQWGKFYSDLPLTIIPSMHQTNEGEEMEKWISPWDLAASVKGGIPQPLVRLKEAVSAYKEGRQTDFDRALQQFNQSIAALPGTNIRTGAIGLEVFYNKLDPFYKAKFFYGFAVIFLLVSLMTLPKWFYRGAFLLLTLGFLLQLAGVSARMYIRMRPPVTNLYETFLFTGLITVLLGIILELWKKRNLGIAAGGLAGLVMLMIAGKYAMEGDTMGMLVAVLDSNFWLASHVITIILGYAGIVLSGFIGHVYIVQKIVKRSNTELLKNTYQALYATQAFGLVFTFLGTVLGGIWADQSWGRFWGWDPKENGALLILLWALILFHARLAGWIKETGLAFGAVVGVVFVSLAWFGVNLLGVGLHSYGFTTGVALSLFIFIGVEMTFIVVTTFFVTLLGNEPKAVRQKGN